MKKELLEKLLEPRQPKYKQIKTLAPFCPICTEQLQGNNSVMLPWKCQCGEWEKPWGSDFYKIKIKSV